MDMPMLRILRPRQWLKNAVVLAALVFAQRMSDPVAVGRALLMFGAFCLLSGAVYVVNDLVDVERDRSHPVKRSRPLPAGLISPGQAALLAAVCAVLGLALCAMLNVESLAVGLSYLILVVAYSLIFKKIVVLDVMVLAMGFVLRAVAGACAIDAEVSPWLIVCTLLLAMFIALGKRRHELQLLEGEASSHRPILQEYSAHLLDQMIAIVSASTIMAYSLYTMSKRIKFALCSDPDSFVGPIARQHLMGLTIPFVLYGLFRYLYLIYRKDFGGAPEKALFEDLPLLVAVLLWMATAAAVLYVS